MKSGKTFVAKLSRCLMTSYPYVLPVMCWTLSDFHSRGRDRGACNPRAGVCHSSAWSGCKELPCMGPQTGEEWWPTVCTDTLQTPEYHRGWLIWSDSCLQTPLVTCVAADVCRDKCLFYVAIWSPDRQSRFEKSAGHVGGNGACVRLLSADVSVTRFVQTRQLGRQCTNTTTRLRANFPSTRSSQESFPTVLP